MKAEFLRHEYTWSKQSISGTMGLGISCSSTPREEVRLRELEKLAAMAEPDSQTGTDVELLMYSMESGFVKMTVKPVPPGEDQRKNKKVYLYQCRDSQMADPAVYCIPQGVWEHTDGEELAPVFLSEDWEPASEIFEKYGFSDRLPDLFRAVFRCVFRAGNNLAFIVPWDREDYALRAREIMYAVHSLLPEDLRKNAGYASYGCGMNRRSSFCFTDSADPESDCFTLSSMEYSGSRDQEDRLDDFFYENLAAIFRDREGLYLQFGGTVRDLIRGRRIDKNLLREVQWAFLRFCLQNMIDIPEHNEVMNLFPQLFYSAGDSPDLQEIGDNLLEYYHVEKWDREDLEKYLKILESGMTRKGEDRILREMDWSLVRLYGKYRAVARDYLDQLRDRNKTLYTRLMSRAAGEEGSISSLCFKENQKDLSSMEEYITGMEPEMVSEDAKEVWMIRGIEILNENVFKVSNYERMTRIADHILWREPWEEVLQGFLTQLKDRCGELTDAQLDASCRIESICEKLTGTPGDGRLTAERERREEKALPAETGSGDSDEDTALVRMAENGDPEGEEPVYRTLEGTEGRDGFLSFLIRGLPYGFLTACIMYLLRYALLIGHWKISLGVGGMWLILMLNYATERVERKKKDGYRLWQALGLCLIEGYILKTIAWMILPQNLRVYFFLVLGIIIVVVQCILGMLLLKKRRMEEEEL